MSGAVNSWPAGGSLISSTISSSSVEVSSPFTTRRRTASRSHGSNAFDHSMIDLKIFTSPRCLIVYRCAEEVTLAKYVVSGFLRLATSQDGLWRMPCGQSPHRPTPPSIREELVASLGTTTVRGTAETPRICVLHFTHGSRRF